MPDLRKLCTIGAISSLGVFAGSIIAPIEARYIESFTQSSFVTGTVFGVSAIFVAFLSFFLGRLSDKWGRKKVMLFGLGLGVISALLYSIVFNVFQIYGVKFAWAFSAVATGPLIAAYLQDFLEPFAKKGVYFGYLYSAQSISGSAGALLGGYFAHTFGLRAPLLALACIFVALFFLTFFLLPRNPNQSVTTAERKAAQAMSVRQAFRYLFSRPALLFYVSVNTSFGVNWGIKAFLWPLIIFELAGSDLVTGSIFATMGVVAFVLLPFAGKVVDALNPFRVAFIELLILGGAGIGLVMADSVSLFWIFAALYTVGEVLNGPVQGVLLTENVETHVRGTIVGLDSAMDQTLGVLAPLFAGVLITLWGLTATLAVFVALFWMSLLCIGFLYRKV